MTNGKSVHVVTGDYQRDAADYRNTHVSDPVNLGLVKIGVIYHHEY